MPVLDPRQIAAWCRGEWKPGAPDLLAGVIHDHRQVEPGSLFVALAGVRHDGHDFVADAFRSGASAALVRGDFAPPPGCGPCLYVQDPLRALGRIASGHRSRLPGRVIAVTGSVGKTTVKEMLANVFAQAARVARSPGNWNTDVGLPLSLLGMDVEDEYGVFELGISHPGEMQPLAEIAAPDWAVVTPIGPAHLEHFGTQEAIAREKACLPASVLPAGGVVLSLDDPWYEVLARPVRARVVKVSMEGAARVDYRGRLTAAGLEIEASADGSCYPVELPVPAVHLADNALRCWAAARELGVPPAQIAGALHAFAPLPMRGTLHTVNGVVLVSDVYNASPLSVRSALQSFKSYPPAAGRWLVLGAMRELGAAARDEHYRLGYDAARGPWRGIFTVGETAAAMAEGAAAGGFPEDRLYRCPAWEAVPPRLSRCAAPGDAVLFKASRGEALERLIDHLLQHPPAWHPPGWDGGTERN